MRYQLDDNGYCCLLILWSVGRTAMMFVTTSIIMDSHITVGINFRGWENFVTAKSTTKVTNISTPRKLVGVYNIWNLSRQSLGGGGGRGDSEIYFIKPVSFYDYSSVILIRGLLIILYYRYLLFTSNLLSSICSEPVPNRILKPFWHVGCIVKFCHRIIVPIQLCLSPSSYWWWWSKSKWVLRVSIRLHPFIAWTLLEFKYSRSFPKQLVKQIDEWLTVRKISFERFVQLSIFCYHLCILFMKLFNVTPSTSNSASNMYLCTKTINGYSLHT